MKIKMVWAKVEFVGFHYWGDAYDKVKFLAEPHRHVFTVRAFKAVSHDDRDVEFIDLGDQLLTAIKERFPSAAGFSQALSLGETSCEALASWLIEEFSLTACSVSEDDENGAVIIDL